MTGSPILGINNLMLAQLREKLNEEECEPQGWGEVIQQDPAIEGNNEGIFSRLPVELKRNICELLSMKNLAQLGSTSKGFMWSAVQTLVGNKNVRKEWAEEQINYYACFIKNILQSDNKLNVSNILEREGGKIKNAKYVGILSPENIRVENYLTMLDAFGRKNNILGLTLKMPSLSGSDVDVMLDKLKNIFKNNKDIIYANLDFYRVELTNDHIKILLPLIPENTYRLCFGLGSFGDESVENFASFFKWSGISELSMSFYYPPHTEDESEEINYPNISKASLERLSKAWPKNIQRLCLEGDKINDYMLGFIFKNLPRSVKSLIFNNNDIDGLFSEEIPENIRSLCIADNYVASVGFKNILKKLPKNFNALSLKSNEIDGGDDGLVNFNFFNKKIKRLSLSENPIGIEGLKKIIKYMPDSVEMVMLDKCGINDLMSSPDKLSLDFRSPIKLPNSLKNLYLSGNNMNEVDVNIFMGLLKFPEKFNALFIDNRIFYFNEILERQSKMAREYGISMN